MVVLTALLPVSPLATYGYALSLSSLVSSFATLRLEQAILVAGSEEESEGLAWSSLLVAFVLASVVVLLDQIGVFRNASNSYTAGAISAFSMSAVNISQQLLIRKSRSGYAGRIAAFRSLVVSASVIAFAWLGPRVNAHAVLLGLGLSSVMVAIGCTMELARISTTRPTFEAMRMAVCGYTDVWVSYLGQSVLSGVSLNAPYFAIFHFADSRYAAAYLLADRVVRMPVTLLSSSVRSHLTHQFRQLIARHEIDAGRDILRKWSLSLASIGLCSLVLGGGLLWMVGTHLVQEKWELAGIAIMIMSVWGAATISNSPAAATLTAYRRTNYILKMQGVELALRVAIIIFAAYFLFNHQFYIGLFLVFVPGIVYNILLWRKATYAWSLPC